MSVAIAQYAPPAALAKPLEWTPEQRKMIRDTYASGANDSEFSMLMQIASVRNLDPIKRQIWFVKRYDSMKKCEVWAPQVSIDGLRTIAQRTGLYDGQDEPEFSKDEYGEFCRVKVYRKDWSRPAVGKAYFNEYAAKKGDGSLTKMWQEKRRIMISKCAEALGLRKAFPEDTAGLYVPEEMPEKDVTPEPVKTARAPSACDALVAEIGRTVSLEALKALVPRLQALSNGEKEIARAAYGERQAALKSEPQISTPRKSADEIEAEERELAEYTAEVDARKDVEDLTRQEAQTSQDNPPTEPLKGTGEFAEWLSEKLKHAPDMRSLTALARRKVDCPTSSHADVLAAFNARRAELTKSSA